MSEISKTQNVSVDIDKLKQCISGSEYTVNELERELGCGCAITNALHRGKIQKPVLILLEKMFGVDLVPTIPEEPVQSKMSDKDKEELLTRIEDIVYTQVRRAINE